MNDAPDRQADQRLLAAVQAFVAAHPDSGVQRFRDGIARWGRDWTGVAPRHLPAADLLAGALDHTVKATHDLAALFERQKASRKWEQSYTRAQGLVGDDMLAAYGFAEVIGKRGPFLSTRVRAGIGVWGPEVLYPPHRHEAEEVYVVLAGCAEFQLGEEGAAKRETRRAGEAVHVTSLLRHGFRTGAEPLVVFYIWQAGDLRQISSFG